MARAYVGRHAFEGPKEEAKALLPRGTKDRLRKLGKRRGLDFADIMREALAAWEAREIARQKDGIEPMRSRALRGAGQTAADNLQTLKKAIRGA